MADRPVIYKSRAFVYKSCRGSGAQPNLETKKLMKKIFYAFVIALGLQAGNLFAQLEIFNWQGYAIGQDASGAAYCAMGAMPDVILINSTYYMYYVARYNNVNAIYYATSPDMINWDVQDTIMTASADTTNRIYDIGGPGVLRLNNGNYRLFYRTSEKATFPNEPLFHIRSMYSTDGIHFTHEAGVRIENQTYQPTSYFKSASHPSVYRDINGNVRAIITGRDTTMNLNSPAGLYTASSNDEGMTWSNFQPMYAGCHDPIVIRDSSDIFHMYTTYMATGHREVTSNDGISWPATPDSMLIRKNNVPLNEMTSAEIIADLGAAVDPSGNIILYSNFKPQGPGPWVDVAYYIHDITSGTGDELNSASAGLYPNPAVDRIVLTGNSQVSQYYEIYNSSGQLVKSGILDASGAVDIAGFTEGIYLVRTCGEAGKEPVVHRFVKR